MKRYFIRTVIAMMCLALLSLSSFAQQKGKPGGGGGGTTSGACAIVVTPTLSTTTIAAGQNVGVFSRVTNCSTSRGRYTVTVSAVSSCGEETIIASSLITFNGGEAKLISVQYLVAPDTCRGVSSVFVNVYSGGNLVASQSSPLTIQ